MVARIGVILIVLSACVSPVAADETLYRYEGDAFPTDRGWLFGGCDPPCTPSVKDGHFVLRHDGAGALVGYLLWISGSDLPPPPPTLWVEWRFRSNHPLGPNFFGCDGGFSVGYDRVFETVNMYGDAAISLGGDFAVLGLAIDDFHTYRFESTDGISFTIAVDGQVFIDLVDTGPSGGALLILRGRGGCDLFPNAVQEWDFIRYGTIATGEQIVASDPPAGVLNSQAFPGLDRFTVTFDSANFVYIDEVAIGISGGASVLPNVIRTGRRENDGPDTVEIVLDRPMPIDRTITFTFNTGLPADCEADPPVNCVKYTLTDLGPVAVCGDSAVNQATEECDNGPDNSDTIPDACRTDCTLARCGDAVTDTGEQCDDGPANSDTTPDACRTDCTLPTCGDNVTDSGEECDGTSDDACPGDPETPGGLCLPDCTCDIPGIPTLSHWGLLALAILLLALSKRHFARSTT